jgi:RNA recognition motif-containing protein
MCETFTVRFIRHAEKYKTCTGIVSFAEINSALAAMDELQHSLLLGRRVEINFNRFRNAGRQWMTSSGPSSGTPYGEGEVASENDRYRELKGVETGQTRNGDGEHAVNDNR